MAQKSLTMQPGGVMLAGTQNGVRIIQLGTPLTRLNYFDGKFLRASDLQAEQRYLRSLVEYSNKATGHGVAYGYDVMRASGVGLRIGAGLAIDADGRVLLMTQEHTVDLLELIEKSRASGVLFQPGATKPGEFGDCVPASENPPGNVLEAGNLYLITIAHAEDACGEEDVFGKLCEEACVTSTDRPYLVEGVVVRARPLQLLVALPDFGFPVNQKHLRSRVASAYYASERLAVASHISKAGLESAMWCFGADPDSGSEVPIGVVGMAGQNVQFLDAWTARRELIDPPAKRYWQWRMRMRPWDVFLAQILQFQCQLHDLFDTPPGDESDDPCDRARRLVSEASEKFTQVIQFYSSVAGHLAEIGVEGVPGGLTMLSSFGDQLQLAGSELGKPTAARMLINGGIIELPSAGYLPVVPGSGATVNQQVRAMMGEGVDLRFCVVSPDFVAHALEEAQHMERISLLEGLENPEKKPQVDILVPNGEIIERAQRSPGTGWEAILQFAPSTESDHTVDGVAQRAAANMRGAARTTTLETGGAAVYTAAAMQVEDAAKVAELAKAMTMVGEPSDTSHADVLETLARESTSGVPGAISGEPILFANLNRVGADATRYILNRRAAEAVFVAPQPAAPDSFQPDQTTQPVATAWITASCAKNPFLMQAGEVTPIDFRIAMVQPGQQTSVSDSQWRGEFRVEQPTSTSGTLRIVSGTAAVLISSESSATNGPVVKSHRFQTKVVLDTADQRMQIDLVSDKSELSFQFTTAWGADPLQAKTRIRYRLRLGEQFRTITVLNSLLTRNPDVLKAGNPSHTLALSAIEIVGAAIGDPGFADASARLLFPPPPPAEQTLQVRATADWVLFHRRRTKVCAEEHIAVTASARRYQLYHLLAPSLESAEMIRRALLSADPAAIARLGFRPVDLVEFGAGVPTLQTPASAVQADWQAASPGNRLIYGAVASAGPAAGEGESLALARLGRVGSAVSAISPPHPQSHSETLPSVPGPLAVEGADGAMMLVTVQAEQKTICHRVLRTLEPLTRVIELIVGGGVPTAVGQGLATDLGSVSFHDLSSEVSGDSLEPVVQAWHEQGDGTIVDSGVLQTADDPNANDQPFNAQATRIVTGIQAMTSEVKEFTSPNPLQTDCTFVTVIQARVGVQEPIETRTGRVFAWTGDLNNRRIVGPRRVSTLEFAADGDLKTNFTDAMVESLKQTGPYFMVELATKEPAPDAMASVRAKTALKALQNVDVVGPTVGVTVRALTAADTALLPGTASDADDIIFVREG